MAGLRPEGARARPSVTMSEIALIGDAIRTSGDDVLVRSQSYTLARRVPLWLDSAGLQETALAQVSRRFSDCEVRREFATAPDGMKLPINIIMRKGTKPTGRADGSLRLGSYGLSEQPYFSQASKVLARAGRHYADASIRGGGWNTETLAQGREARKRRNIDGDSPPVRATSWRGVTRARSGSPIEGGSAGGLLVYGTWSTTPAFMQAPSPTSATATCCEPSSHQRRIPTHRVRDREGLAAIRRDVQLSPYHHVQDGRPIRPCSR